MEKALATGLAATDWIRVQEVKDKDMQRRFEESAQVNSHGLQPLVPARLRVHHLANLGGCPAR
jgi:hypothetical protein